MRSTGRPAKAMIVVPVIHDSPIPAYVQVEQDIRRVILGGAIDRIPPEVELAQLYGVSRVTIRQSLQRLAAAGLVKREHGRGTSVIGRPQLALDLGLFRSVTDQLREAGHVPRFRILDQSRITPPPEIVAPLELRPREKVVKIRRLVLADDVPVSINTSWYPAKLVPGLEKARIEDESVWTILSKRYAIGLVAVDNRLEVIASGAEEAELLQIDFATPLVRLVSCFRGPTGQPIEFSVSLWRSAQIRFHFSQRV